MTTMRQTAPYPQALADLVARVRYKEDWEFTLEDIDRGQGSMGLTLIIKRYGPDAYHPERNLPVNHYFIVPAAAYNERSWRRWLFDQICLVERHEAAEFFRLEWDEPQSISGVMKLPDARHVERPYAPLHGPGNDPYLIAELASDRDRRTSFRGELNPDAP